MSSLRRIERNIKLAKDILARLGVEYKFDWEIYDQILKENLLKNKSWLDVGCGANEIIHSFDVEFKLGMDTKSPESVKLPKDFCCSSVYHLPFKSESFDIVTARFFVEHLKSPLDAFSEIKRVLKINGLFILHTTNKFSPIVFIKNLIPQKLLQRILAIMAGVKETHPCYYRYNSLKEFKQGINGFKKIREIYIYNLFIFIRIIMLIDVLLYIIVNKYKFRKLCPVFCGIYKRIS